MWMGGVGRVDWRRGWGWGGVGRDWTVFGVLLCCQPFCQLCPEILDPHVLDPHVHRLEIEYLNTHTYIYIEIDSHTY